MSGARVMSHTPRIPLSCSHTRVVGASISMPSIPSVPPLPYRTEEPQGGGQLVPAVVKHEDAPALPHLLELPLVAAAGDVPPAPSAGHHLHVVAAHVADGAGLDHFLEPDQRLVEDVVLHDPQEAVVGPGCLQHL